MTQPMLYASVLHLDRHSIQALKVTDPYSLHRVVYSLFDDVRSEASKQGHTPAVSSTPTRGAIVWESRC